MEDYSHLHKATGVPDVEGKALIHNEEDAKALLERMKYISRLISDGAITFLR